DDRNPGRAPGFLLFVGNVCTTLRRAENQLPGRDCAMALVGHRGLEAEPLGGNYLDTIRLLETIVYDPWPPRRGTQTELAPRPVKGRIGNVIAPPHCGGAIKPTTGASQLGVACDGSFESRLGVASDVYRERSTDLDGGLRPEASAR